MRWCARMWLVIVASACGGGSIMPPDAARDRSPQQDTSAAVDAGKESQSDAPGIVEAGQDASLETLADATADTYVDAPADALADTYAEMDAAPDVVVDTASDPRDAPGADVVEDAGRGHPYVYLAIASNAAMPRRLWPTDLVLFDVAARNTIRDTMMIGTLALAYKDGKLLVARGAGYRQISILNANTLALEATQPLPWDPVAAVFSSDARYLYVSHAEARVAIVRLSDGAVVDDMSVPLPAGLPAGSNGDMQHLALSPTADRLVGTTFTGFEASPVDLFSVRDEKLSLVRQWVPEEFSQHPCTRWSTTPLFSRDGKRFATLDLSCGAIDVYDPDIGTGPAVPTTFLGNPNGCGAPFGNLAEDALGQFWAIGCFVIYRVNPRDAAKDAVIAFDSAGGVTMADPLDAVYAWVDGPRRGGVFAVDPTTGPTTRFPWTFDLVSEQGMAALGIWVER